MNNTDLEFSPSFLNNGNEGHFRDPIDLSNGLSLINIFIPEEVLLDILSYVDPKELLNLSLVCHKWNRLIKSRTLWCKIYNRKYINKAKELPWYLYYCLLSTNYFDNIIVNEKGEDAFKYWKLTINTRENSSVATGSLIEPNLDQQEIDMFTLKIKTRLKVLMPLSCRPSPNFCEEQWLITLTKNKLFHNILNNYKPHIYIKNCGYIEELQCGLLQDDIFEATQLISTEVSCEEAGLVITDYPAGIQGVLFAQSRNTFKRCQNLNKGVVRFLFDSIGPLCSNEHGNKYAREFSNRLIFKKLSEEDLTIDID